MIIFSAPSRGQQVLTPLGVEQTTSLLVVLIYCKESIPALQCLVINSKRLIPTNDLFHPVYLMQIFYLVFFAQMNIIKHVVWVQAWMLSHANRHAGNRAFRPVKSMIAVWRTIFPVLQK